MKPEIDSGIEQLRAATQKEDALKYYEPPRMDDSGASLARAVLMKQQHFADAE
jgi:hypothetical protein